MAVVLVSEAAVQQRTQARSTEGMAHAHMYTTQDNQFIATAMYTGCMRQQVGNPSCLTHLNLHAICPARLTGAPETW